MNPYPYIVFANLGTSDNLVPVKYCATEQEAQDWIDEHSIERPGHYHIASSDEFNDFA